MIIFQSWAPLVLVNQHLFTSDTPTAGEYYLEDKLVSNYTDEELAGIRNRFFGFVFQNFSLLPRLTALDNVALPLIYAGVKRNERTKKAEQMLDKIGLKDRIHVVNASVSPLPAP